MGKVVQEQVEKIKINSHHRKKVILKSLLITKIFCRFSWICIKKTTFDVFEEICEQIHRKYEIH